ncbi:membrane protein [Deinococcus malanensis]|uniref:Membrane protein n=2 Tax=Deinococcus malanensis TaxID=1706855 RepID=A0ABQ2ELG3_9DEIO|nr:membrane protein [Deinococcus malanensis]
MLLVMGFLLRLLVTALALYVLTRVYSGVTFAPGAGLVSILIAALVMGIVNALIRPVLLLLSLPINVLTLGLFTLVVNAVVLLIVAAVTALNVAGFGAAFIGALLLTIISWVLDAIVGALGLDGGRD